MNETDMNETDMNETEELVESMLASSAVAKGDYGAVWLVENEAQVIIFTFLWRFVSPEATHSVRRRIVEHMDTLLRTPATLRAIRNIYAKLEHEMDYAKECGLVTAIPPRHVHDCDACTFLGCVHDRDLYYCTDHNGGSAVTVRYGPGDEFRQGDELVMLARIGVHEALEDLGTLWARLHFMGFAPKDAQTSQVGIFQ